MRKTASGTRWIPTAALLIVLAATSVTCRGRRSVDVEGVTVGPAVASTRGVDISLSGRVTAMYGPYVFTVGSGGERVIVVVGRPTGAAIGKEVDVTGRVRTFSRRQLEFELGVNFGPEVEQLENGRCLVARVVRFR